MLLYVGRYTEVKRIPLLIEAYERARPGFNRRRRWCSSAASPASGRASTRSRRSRRVGAQDVFLAGWHDHEELPELLAAADVIVLPSVREQFGQVLVEGMACGLPAIAVDAYGPAEIVSHGGTGWLVEPDDVARWRTRSCTRSTGPRSAAGAPPPRQGCPERYAWPALAERVADVYATSLREGHGFDGLNAA